MRTSLLYGCFGLLSISSLAGCGLFSSCHDNCACNNRPVPRMVVRNGVVVAAPAEPVIIYGSSRPVGAPAEQIVVIDPTRQVPATGLPLIPTLPVPTSKDPLQPVPPVDSNPLSQQGISNLNELKNMLPLPPIDMSQGNVMPREKVGAGVEPSRSDKSVNVQYGHSEDFRTVTGRVQMWRGTVRLRYAPIDQEDQYGGFVVLDGGAELTRLRDAQQVRIRGVLIAPENRNSMAHFQVQAIELLD